VQWVKNLRVLMVHAVTQPHEVVQVLLGGGSAFMPEILLGHLIVFLSCHFVRVERRRSRVSTLDSVSS
jgi:F0F1-type ATP synthase assembly protein I